MGILCSGIQLHVDTPSYLHAAFKPWRLIAAILKAQRALDPESSLWRDFAYEYEPLRLAFDVINGGPRLRQWIEDPKATAADLNAMTMPDERAWQEARESVLIYRD